jgi:regulator of protease activity HflC (stomatin/prohibitin superfamily)
VSQRKINILITLLASLLLLVIFLDRFIMVNGPATSSIVFRPFSGGVDTHNVYGEGIFFTAPWNNVYRFNTREQMVEDTMHIMVLNGVTVTMRVNYRYRPIVDSLPVIFRQYGINYDKVFIDPQVVSSTSEVISHFTPEQVYSLRIDSIRQVALEIARRKLHQGNIFLGDLVISNIKLPPKVVDAIEYKLRQEQLAIAYNYKIIIAQKEKQIKIIDAEATKSSQALVNPGLTPGYLQLRQIEALQNLSLSPNAKTIVVPRGNSTPIILNNGQ